MRGLNTQIHLAVDAHGMPIRILATEATRADSSLAPELIEGLSVEHLTADKGDDTIYVSPPHNSKNLPG